MKWLSDKPAFAAVVWSGLWLTLSEVVRYFVYVMPETREHFAVIEGVAPMNLGVFVLWSLWMTLLTLVVVYFYWLHAKVMGHSLKAVLLSASTSWLMFFVLFWFGNLNMGLAKLTTAVVALPWAWFELLVTCWIAKSFLERSS
ncbi:hypothetical protein EYS14_16660 [Alteromonadaceae bacterium M269]|nr:hypothetical protein EYS14_16660 [Alteromonadaceae bacterium M269]